MIEVAPTPVEIPTEIEKIKEAPLESPQEEVTAEILQEKKCPDQDQDLDPDQEQDPPPKKDLTLNQEKMIMKTKSENIS